MRILGLKEVLDRVPFSRATLYREIKRGKFPAPIKVSLGRVGWPEPEIDEHQRKLIAAGIAEDSGDTK